HCSGLSSEPSSQSGSPSHYSAHVFFTTRFFSSLPSTQSSSPSHFHSRVMQRPFVHWNWELSHLAQLSRGAQHSASSSHSAQRADVPMLPARMVPPPPSLSPFAPHNKLPALRRGGRRWGRGGRRRGGGGRSEEPGARRARKERAPFPCNLHALLSASQPPATHPVTSPAEALV
uniref:Uncharacterized protein n=1 Tax=Cricetulus griseus TaxID=10029 RepID=A0A8C2MHN8_CRIGR